MDQPNFHPLLRKQLSKYLPESIAENEHFQNFIRVVNESYRNFERDKELFEHSSQLNEKEYASINAKLTKEINERRLSVEKLMEAIRSLEMQDEFINKSLDSNNLLALVDVLQVQIEHRKKVEAELRKSKEIAELATHAKSEFLSMMSHEIRTPLNAIVGLTYLMQQEEVSHNMAENLRILQFSTDNLHVLINDILDFSKIEAGKVDLEKVPFDVKQLVSNIKKANQVKAEEKGNKIKLMIDDDVPQVLMGDILRLGQIISNLVSNAVKFTRNGSITIELSLQSKTETKVTLDFSVTDTGIGIPKNKQQLIFDRFTQANSQTTREFGGTGLGLVITKKLLELYGSEIQIESEVGKGSRFYFTLELDLGADQRVRVDESSTYHLNEFTLKGLRILLVEDYPMNVKVARKFLERWNIEVDLAENGKIALEMYEPQKYDLILMDIQMPVMDGYTATEKIRELDIKIPIIALTASATLSNQDLAFQIGMSDYVTKPFNPKELFQKIAKHSGR
ncbi:response regulator [Arundinibacter roseus]|uniref:histidine kinase n=1 Tax=Arundinibacter roseus TaxID=2070510 RepID=A0A4R4KEH2_9BACT|nr:response regulator [Arundinibacter roseus]TDB65232.1 response regulator [Arundinibacter roseus]